MHPNPYLKTLWRNETIDQVFVAMPFSKSFLERFENVIKPAIEEHPIAGFNLKAYRVDNSQTGDSILTEIVSGIAHSRIVLADVSVEDEGRYTGKPVRNANVLYEVGLALACRTPAEVLLIRDDDKSFLFDVSSIPHIRVDFGVKDNAVSNIRKALVDRLQETRDILDARIMKMARELTSDELRILNYVVNLPPDECVDYSSSNLPGQTSIPNSRGIEGLLRKGCIKSVSIDTKNGTIFYSTTPFGYNLGKAVKQLLPEVENKTVLPK